MVLLAAIPAAHATIVGLNQIVTPDTQPAGVLGLSTQVENSAIGDSQQIQLELGITPRFEVAWFQGLTPGVEIFSTELNLIQEGPSLLTAGLVNWSTRGERPQPVLEYGYYRGADHFIAGIIDADRRAELLLGYRRQLTEKVQLSADFQAGPANAATLGVVYNFTPELSVNPAVYRSNARPHHLFGYVVLTWNLTLWK
jgi:hypothetical protein